MELSTISLPDFVKLGEVIFTKGKDSVSSIMRTSGFYNVTNEAKNTGNTREFSEIDLEEYASNKGESAQSSRAKTQQGYTKIMKKKRVSKDIGISYELINENKYQDVVRKLTSLGKLVGNRMDLDLAHRITFATSTSYTDKDGDTVTTTVGDGLALASTAHTVKGSSTTYRNILANNPRLSKGALEGMERLVVEETVNQFGEKVTDFPFDKLWTTDDPNTVNTAREYLQSTADVEGANSGVKNVYASKYAHVIFPRVATLAGGGKDTTKRFYWGLFSSTGSNANLGIWEESRMKAPKEEDFSTDDTIFGARGGYGIVILNGTFFKISKGNGDA